MNKSKNTLKILPFLFIFCFIFSPISSLANNLAGKIFLQVEQNGEAWYVNPDNQKRYFLGRPADAFLVIKEQGVGISNKDLAKIPISLDYLSGLDSDGDALPDDFEIAIGTDPYNTDSDLDGFNDYQELSNNYNPLGQGILSYDLDFSKNQSGRILLQVEQNGEAWYVSPDNQKRYFLGRPADAFSLMRNLGLGISDKDLANIEIFLDNSQTFSWRYNNKEYFLEFTFSEDIFNLYNQDSKSYFYFEGEEPDDLRNEFYSLFLQTKEEDKQTLNILHNLIDLAEKEGFSNDEQLEFILAFIQNISYDYDKAESDQMIANFPFETLYLNKGVCSDTSFLAVLWARELGYGSAILDFPEKNHTALGIQCPIELSIENSGYCYVETTNYFPFGVVPSDLSGGLPELLSENYINYFSIDNLGEIEIRQKQIGQVYQGVLDNILIVEELQELKTEIDLLLSELAKEDLSNRNEVITEYNKLAEQYNQAIKEFYQLK
jgi:hypothetical protein